MNTCLLDLKKAYLQINVNRSLQQFQAVKFRGNLYVMTRMGFGLNVAPKTMSKVLDKVLSMDANIEKGTDHYIDDIWIGGLLMSINCYGILQSIADIMVAATDFLAPHSYILTMPTGTSIFYFVGRTILTFISRCTVVR